MSVVCVRDSMYRLSCCGVLKILFLVLFMSNRYCCQCSSSLLNAAMCQWPDENSGACIRRKKTWGPSIVAALGASIGWSVDNNSKDGVPVDDVGILMSGFDQRLPMRKITTGPFRCDDHVARDFCAFISGRWSPAWPSCFQLKKLMKTGFDKTAIAATSWFWPADQSRIGSHFGRPRFKVWRQLNVLERIKRRH